MGDEPIRVGVVEDDPDMCAYLAALVSGDPDFTLAFASETLADARQQFANCAPDICLVDIKLPDGTGLDFIGEAGRAEEKGCKFLILTVLGDRTSVLLAFESGANGYLLKDTAPNQIKRDIKAVVSGGNPISPQAASHLLAMVKQRDQAVPTQGSQPEDQTVENILSQREREVLELVAKGLSNKEIAKTAALSVHTVSDHLKSIYAKMQVHSRNEAVFEAVQNGWLDR